MITTHILDTSCGRPAPDVSVRLEVESSPGNWNSLSSERTNSDGRITAFRLDKEISPGNYRLIFATASYFRARKLECFYPEVMVTFRVDQCEHYHVPLLLNPFGYSTYRGS